MSWYETVVLSFSCDEYEDEEDESCHDCAGLRGVNAWLEQEGYSPLVDLNTFDGGELGSNAVLFGGCYNYLDVDRFLKVTWGQEWKHLQDVQVLWWDDNASRFTVIQIYESERGDANMPNVQRLERAIQKVEGFQVTIRHADGRDMRSDKEGMRGYPFRRGAKNDFTVAKWREQRFQRNYPGFDVSILLRNGAVASGGMKLATVRDSYVDR